MDFCRQELGEDDETEVLFQWGALGVGGGEEEVCRSPVKIC